MPARVRGRGPSLVSRLAEAGCVAPRAEAGELVRAAAGDPDLLERLVCRRVAGEPLAWVTGSVRFAGLRVRVDPGVYVPRWQTEPLARRAARLLPEHGLAADLCTGSGAIALVLGRARPGARVVATDLVPAACRCAADNGVEVYCGYMAEPLPAELRGHFDVVVAVVPYVPTDQLVFLPRDVRDYEPVLALDGGAGGTRLLEEAVRAGAGLLRPGGALLLELGAEQDGAIAPELERAGYGEIHRFLDAEGDLRGIEAVRQ